MKDTLEIRNLKVEASGKKILQGVNLKIKRGEIHVLMGPNGAGKTSLIFALMGHPRYKITDGQITINNKNITNLTADQRAKLGIFVSFQRPVEIPGVSVRNLLRLVVKENLEEKISQTAASLKIDRELLTRHFENFSGGEGKKIELLQAKIIPAKFLILDEIDSGLDIDALRLVARDIQKMAAETAPGILLITHYPKILKFVKPDHVHVLIHGNIIKTDGEGLIDKLEKKGYQSFQK